MCKLPPPHRRHRIPGLAAIVILVFILVARAFKVASQRRETCAAAEQEVVAVRGGRGVAGVVSCAGEVIIPRLTIPCIFEPVPWSPLVLVGRYLRLLLLVVVLLVLVMVRATTQR